MNINTRPLLITAVVIVIIVVGAYIFLEKMEKTKKENDNISKNEFYSAPFTTFGITQTKEELKLNTKPKLNVGEKWTYNVIMNVISDNITGDAKTEKIIMDVIYYIEKIERVNRSDCYVIRVETYDLLRPDLNVEMPKYIIYLSKDTGELVKVTVEYMIQDEKSGRLRPHWMDLDKNVAESALYGGLMIGDFILQDWMLALSKDFKWRVYSNMTFNEKHIEEVLEYVVEGIETVNGRECFKVDLRAFNVKENRVTVRKIIWVDVDRRVVIKGKTMTENLELSETNLKDITYI